MSGFNLILQRVPATDQFDGNEPATVPVIDKGFKQYPTDGSGGKFDFENPDWNVKVEHVFGGGGGGATNWTVVLTDGSVTVPIASLPNSNEIILNDPCIIPAGWWLKITTTGASTLMSLVVMGSKLAPFPS